MKVAISVIGRFHLFNLAQQLLKRDYLAQLITSYPKFEVAKYGISKDKVSSVLIKEILQRGWQVLPEALKKIYNPQYLIHEIFDVFASRSLKEGADIVIGGGRVRKKAKSFGALTIGERGSSHVLYQNKLLKEEYELCGLKIEPYMLPHPKVIEDELRDYETHDYISIPSSFVKRTFLEYGIPEKKLIQIPYGVDLSSFRQVSKEDDVFRVIFAGGMTVRKGVHYLLRAFSELHLLNAELLLIGSLNDDMKPFFKKYAGSFTHVGHVPQPELYKYYSQGNVFCIMSIEEGMAMVQPQAMACGLPIICTTNTGGEDIARNGVDGFVIPIRSVETLKEKLMYLYEYQDIAHEMGRSAKAHVQNNFTWDLYGERMIAAYNQILHNS